MHDDDQRKNADPAKPDKPLRVVTPLEPRSLSDAHRAHLRSSGLSDETIELAGLYTARVAKEIAELLNWKAWRNGDALVFPFVLPGSSTPAMHRVRPSRPRASATGKLVKYEQPKDVAIAPYFPPRARSSGWLGDVSKPLLWIEGEKKALLLDQLSYPAIGGTGVSCFHDPELRRDQGLWKLAAKIIEHAAIAGRRHLIPFDSDSETNDQVMLAARRLAGMLVASGAADVKFVRIPMGPNGEKLGIDDFFVLHGEAATRALLENGLVDIDPLPVEEPFTPLRSLRALRDAPIDERLQLPGGYDVDPHGALWTKPEDADGKARPEQIACATILLRRILVDLYSGEERVEVTFRRDGAWRAAIVERAVVCSANKIVDALAGVGAPIDSGNAAAIVKWIRHLEHVNERRLPRSHVVSSCGWHDVGDRRTFLAPDSLVEGVDVAFDGSAGRSRIVRGLKSSGDVEAHVGALRRAFASDRIAATAICGALAAPMLRILGAPAFAIHLVGDSSRGKSSMLKIAASIYGDPSSEDWIPSWNSTVVGLEQRAATLNDLPFCIDEAGVVDPKQREQATYMLIDGTGRTRGARGGGLRETANWRTIVLSTGEHGLVDEDANTGAQVRILQCYVDGFGDLDAAGVDALRSTCAENFGSVGRFWLSELVELDAGLARETFRTYLKAARSRVVGQGLRARQAEYLAVLGFVEGLAHRAMNVGDPNGATMLSWLEEDDGGSRRRVVTVAERALALVQDWFASNRNSFAEIGVGLDGRREARDTGSRELFGYRDEEAVSFIPTALRTYLAKHGVDWQVTREWHRRGWLISNEPERGTRRSMLNGSLVRTVSVRREVLLGDGLSQGNPL